jgi:prepilin signal peptidase PulO-like enzyme (type II secretory pathway)
MFGYPIEVLLILMALGAACGSFLNVIIYRIPNKGLKLTKSSFCPNCKAPIKIWDNIPLISYLILLGKCRNCKVAISPRYPIVELIGMVTVVFIPLLYGWTWLALINILLLFALTAIAFIDAKHRIIPDEIALPFMVIGLLSFLVNPERKFMDGLLGFLVGGGFMYLIAELGDRFFIRESPLDKAQRKVENLKRRIQNLPNKMLHANDEWTRITYLLGSLGYFEEPEKSQWLYMCERMEKLERQIKASEKNIKGYNLPKLEYPPVSLGGGDIKLMAMVGAFLNWYNVLIAIFIGSLLGSIVGLPARIKGHKSIPFGPTLVIGSITMLIWKNEVLNWLINLLY